MATKYIHLAAETTHEAISSILRNQSLNSEAVIRSNDSAFEGISVIANRWANGEFEVSNGYDEDDPEFMTYIFTRKEAELYIAGIFRA